MSSRQLMKLIAINMFWSQATRQWCSMAPSSPILAVPNVTAHPSTASVPITVLLYDGLLVCGFNVAIKGIITALMWLIGSRIN